ncbi:MAG TPA: hypothetical protein O0X50_02880 [Methanocorpusculum sp.]|nr:hypothetical protein [Methanocorpusculum sp.]
MREFSFPLHALGSDAPARIELPDLAAWIASIRGTEVDLISYQTDVRIAAQVPSVSIPAAGGSYYLPRLLEAFNAPDAILTNAPELNTAAIETDISIARKTAKTCRFSLPSPASLSVTDDYFHDSDELMEALTDTYAQLGRCMRDNGVSSCVILGDNPSEIELERLHGMKYLWSTSASALETVLEHTRDIVVPGTEISRIAELIDSYAIRNVYIKDVDAPCLGAALEIIECDHIFTAGYADAEDTKTYWENLANLKIQLSDFDS